jgi:hypothetical protein
VQPVDDDLIVRALENACNNENLIFQVIQDLPYLYVYVNRLEERPLDYDLLSQQIFATITGLSLTDITGLGIFSRPCDLPEPDWQTFLELSVPEVSVPAEDVSAPQSEVSNPEPEIIPEPQAAAPKQLADYCFIRNKALLTTKILPPEPNIAKLVKFFDDQPENRQLELLPVLEVHLRTPSPELGEPFDPEVQAWLGELGQLKDMDARNIGIWLSRYCLDPAQAMTAVTAVLTDKPFAPEPTPTTATTTSSTSATSTITPAAGGSYSGNSPYAPSPASRTSSVDVEQSKQGFQAGRLSREWALILSVGWFFVTLIVITLALKSLDPTKIVQKTCAQSSNQPYCALAVQIIGEVTYQEDLPQRFPLSDSDKEEARKACYLAGIVASHGGNIFAAGESLQDASKLSLSQENLTEVLPNLWLVEFQHKQTKPPENMVRTACTFAKLETEDNPEMLGHALIPVDWPKTVFKPAKMSPENLRRALGVFNLFISFGMGTLFTALAIFVAAFFRFGVEVDSFEALGMAAFCLGLIESVTQFIPVWGFFGWIALQSLALGLVSIVVKGFRVRWEEGYRWVMLGTVLITGVRLYLNLLLFNFLAGLV